MNSFRISLTGLIATAFISTTVSTARAQYLTERLVPPQQVLVSPIPMVAHPTGPMLFSADTPKAHLWALPFSPFPGNSASLASERQPANWQRLVIDIPSLASEIDPTRPVFPMLPTSSRAYATSTLADAPPAPVRFPMFVQPVVAAADDPSSQAAYSLLTVGIPLAIPNPAPLARMSVPDPFEYIANIRLANAPADSDASALAQERPPLAKLPQVDPAK